MRPALAAILSFALAALAAAQPPLGRLPVVTAPNFQPGFGGISNEQFLRSNVGLTATQLFNDLNTVKAELGLLNLPAAAKFQLVREADLAVREADELRLLAATNTPLDRLKAADGAVDRVMDDLLNTIGRNNIGSAGLGAAIARAQYADQQLHAAFSSGGGWGGGGWPGGRPPVADNQIARLAATLDDQAELLRNISRETLGAAPVERQLELAIRTYLFRVQRFRRAADAGTPVANLAADFEQIKLLWTNVGNTMATFRVPNPIRVQVAYTDGTMKALDAIFQGNAGGGWGGGSWGGGFIQRGAFVVGAGEGGGPRVRVFSDMSGAALYDFYVYDENFRGGVRVATADLNGDGIPDLIVAPGPGMIPLVRIFDGRSMRLSAEFLAFDRAWTGGVFVAAADRTRDGKAMVAVSADAGAGPNVRVFDISTGKDLDNFLAFDERFRGGARVAMGDVNGDGVPDLIAVPGPGGPPQVRVFDGRNRKLLADFMAFDARITTGLNVAAGDLTKNGRADVIVGTEAGGPPLVAVYDVVTLKKLGEIAPFPAVFRGGVRVALYDYNNNGIPDVVCAPGRDSIMPIRVFDGRNAQPLGEFFPFGPAFRGGAFIGSK